MTLEVIYSDRGKTNHCSSVFCNLNFTAQSGKMPEPESVLITTVKVLPLRRSGMVGR